MNTFPSGKVASSDVFHDYYETSMQINSVRSTRPNPSIERTRTGRALQAPISFWALRAPPARAAHVKR